MQSISSNNSNEQINSDKHLEIVNQINNILRIEFKKNIDFDKIKFLDHNKNEQYLITIDFRYPTTYYAKTDLYHQLLNLSRILSTLFLITKVIQNTF